MKQNLVYLTIAVVLCAVSTEVVTAQITTKRADTLVLRTRSVTKKLVVGDSSATVTLPSQSGTLAIEGSVSSLPIGTITTISRKASIPDGFVACDGQAISRSEYADLYSAIGTTYGAGNGSTTFNVPKILDPYIPRDGLLGWWPFSGNMSDVWIRAYTGTAQGNAALVNDRFGNASECLTLDGTDDHVTTNLGPNDLFGLADFSVSAWIKLGNLDSYYGYSILSNLNPSNVQMCFLLVGSETPPLHRAPVLSFATGLTFNAYTSTGQVVVVGEWTHVAAVRDGGEVRFYINGALSSTVAVNAAALGNEGTPPSYRIGRGNPTPGFLQDFNGQIDELGLWNRALTANEVKQLFDATSRYVIRAQK